MVFTVSASPGYVCPALQVPISLVSHSVFQLLLFLWDPPGYLLLSAFDKEITWNGSRQAQVMGPPATISSALLDSVVVLGFTLHVSFLLKLAFNSFIQWSEKRNYDERHYSLGPGKAIC